MKTIRETIGDNWCGNESAIAALEAREKERDAAEQERVMGKLLDNGVPSLIAELYPSPKPEPVKLKAGWYWWRISPEYSWVCSFQREDFKPLLREYRAWNDPPPEVTGKVEPTPKPRCNRRGWPLVGEDTTVSDTNECDHKFIFLRTAKWIESTGGYNSQFVRVDTFFCEKCLKQEEKRQEDWKRETPTWYRGD